MDTRVTGVRALAPSRDEKRSEKPLKVAYVFTNTFRKSKQNDEKAKGLHVIILVGYERKSARQTRSKISSSPPV